MQELGCVTKMQYKYILRPSMSHCLITHYRLIRRDLTPLRASYLTRHPTSQVI